MTREEYDKAKLYAQVYRAQVRENHLLRQKLAGTDPESMAMDRQDREAFALVQGKKNQQGQLPVVQVRTAERQVCRARKTEAGTDPEGNLWVQAAVIIIGMTVLLAQILQVAA